MTPKKMISIEKKAEESEQIQLLDELEARKAELLVLNSIQEGLASGLEIDSIFELAGERIAEIFPGKGIALYTFDPETQWGEAKYILEDGVRHYPPPFESGPIGKKAAETKQPLVLSSRAEFEAIGATTIQGTAPSLSGIYTPLIVHDTPVGALNIESSKQEHAFDDSDVRMVTTIAGSLSVALENARLFDQVQKSNFELSEALEYQTATSEILSVMADAPTEISQVLSAVAESAARLFEAIDVQIYRVDGDALRQVTHFGPSPSIQDGETLPLVRGLITGRAVLDRKTIPIEDLTQISESEYPDSVIHRVRFKGTRSCLVTPMVKEGEAIGAIVVRRNHVQPFTDKEISLLSTFANQAAIAIENVRLFNETEQRSQELAIINGVQSALAVKLDIQAIYDEVGDTIQEVFSDAQVVDILNYDDSTKLLHPRYVIERGKRYEIEPWPARGFRKHVIETGQTLVINDDMENMAQEYDNDWVVVGEFAQSWVGVPMKVGNEVTGVISIQHIDREHAFSETDIRLLETLANSMSVALENARLFDQVHKSNLELSEALEQQSATSEILRVMASSQSEIQPVLDAVAKNAAKLCEADDVQIYRVEEDRLSQAAHFGPLPALEDGESLPLVPGLITGRAVLEQRTIHTHDSEQISPEDFPESYELQKRLKHRSVIVTPLVREGEAIGAIVVRRNEVKPFSEKQVTLLATFANQAAIAIENVRLFNETTRLLKETEERNAELAIINSVQAALAAKLDLQAIYEAVGEELRQIFDSQIIAIYSADLQTRINTTEYAYEKGQKFEPVSIPISSLHDHLIALDGTYVFNGDFPEFAAQFKDYRVSAGEMPKSLVGVPVGSKKGATKLLTLTLQDIDGEKVFTDSDVRLLETLANSMSVALENARLFDETQLLLQETEQRAAELQIINSVQEALASKLDMQAIYDLVGDKIREIFKADTTFMAFHDIEKDFIVAPYYTDKGERIETTTRPYGQGLVEIMIESGKSLLLNTADEMNASGAYNIASPGSDKDLNQSFLGVPIFRGGSVIGATSVQSYQQYAYNSNDLSLLQTLTNSMSVALENARLFDETQLLLRETEKRAAELTTINTVSKALVAESDLDALIQIIGEQIRQSFSADIVYVALHDEQTGEIQFPYTYGEDFNVLKLGEGLTSKIIESGEPLLINREMEKRRAEMGVTRVGVSARSYLGVPIKMRGQTFGVISVQSTSEEGRFGEDDRRLLNTIAANVGTAIHNAQLFKEVKRQSEYYAAVIDYSPAAIVLLDMDANVTGWNSAAERLFGYSVDEALGRNIDDLVAKSDSLHSEAVRYSQKALQEKQVHLLARRTRKDGSLVDVEVSGVPIKIDGKQEVFLAIYHDVSELQRARKEAEQANRAKSTFLANMSHELRTPLNAILGFTRIVRRKSEDALPEKQLDNLDKVLVSADHLLNLINTVLDISKIEAGRVDVQPTSFVLPPLIELVVSTGEPLLRKGVTLKIDVPPKLPHMYSDQDKLKQILLNLLSNAAKFTHEGEITISARDDGERVYIDVNDTGIGVSEDALTRIFEDFQQADSSTTREYGGTGLGLPISRSLARLLDGDLVACSIEGEGSTFTLTLPIQYIETAHEETPAVTEAG